MIPIFEKKNENEACTIHDISYISDGFHKVEQGSEEFWKALQKRYIEIIEEPKGLFKDTYEFTMSIIHSMKAISRSKFVDPITVTKVGNLILNGSIKLHKIGMQD